MTSFTEDTSTPEATARYIPFPKAYKNLAQRLNATPEEIAAWVFMGEKNGGLDAFSHVNDPFASPRRFSFGYHERKVNYLSPLVTCWFRRDDIDNFNPRDRFITGKALIERWGELLGMQPEGFIEAKIAESRLSDLHPTFGGTRATEGEGYSEEKWLPLIESGVFALSEVEAIEQEDFDPQQSNAREQDRQQDTHTLAENEESASRKNPDQPAARSDPLAVFRAMNSLRFNVIAH